MYGINKCISMNKKHWILMYIITGYIYPVFSQSNWHPYLDKNEIYVNKLEEYMGENLLYIGTRLLNGDNHEVFLLKDKINKKGLYYEVIIYQMNSTLIQKGIEASISITYLCDCENFKLKDIYLFELETGVSGPSEGKWQYGIGDSMGSRILSSVCNLVNSYKEYISLKLENGVYKIPVTINNHIQAYFIFDTGASDLYISPELADKLLANDIYRDSFVYLKTNSYVDANGNIEQCKVYRLKSVKIGNRIVNNVECAVSNGEIKDMLLGQSFLNKLGSFEFDYNLNMLILN